MKIVIGIIVIVLVLIMALFSICACMLTYERDREIFKENELDDELKNFCEQREEILKGDSNEL